MSKSETSGVFVERPQPVLHPSAVGSLVSVRTAVRGDVPILELADQWQELADLPVVTVLDPSDRIVGVIEYERLFGILGKPFGRDIMQRNTANDLAIPVLVLDQRSNIFAIARDLGHLDLQSGPGSERSAYIALRDEHDSWSGLVYRHDINDYLASITSNDVEMAARLQERMSASALQHDGSACAVDAFSVPAMGVGGDIYYCRSLPEGRLFAALCDVSGKGLAASLIVALVWGCLKAYDYSRGLKELLVLINNAIVHTFQLEKYLTGVFLLLDAKSGRLVCADMGHAHILLIRDGQCRTITSQCNNLPIGLDPELNPRLYAFAVRPGDSIVVYSDGITEQTDAHGHEFGEIRLRRLLRQWSVRHDQPLERLVMGSLARFRGSSPQHDDCSLLALTVPEADREPKAAS